MKLSLDALQILDAIDARGSYAAAAQDLHRVPSALTHAMQKLEAELGVALFEKSGRRATLTPAGRTLLGDGRHLLRAAAELECRVKRVATGWETELTLGVDMLIPAQRLWPLLERFYALGRGTRIRLGYEVLGGAWDALATGRADLVIGAPGDLPSRSGISSRSLGTYQLLFAVAPHHPLAALPDPLSREELIRHRAVVVPDSSQELLARSTGILEGQDILWVPDMAAKLAAQEAGLGVGHLPPWQVRPAVAAGRLVIKRLADDTPPLACYTAWRTKQAGKALAWFLEELERPEVRAALTEGLA